MRRKLALWRFDFFLAWSETAEDFRDLLGDFSRLGERLKLFVYVCCVSLFTRPDGADYDKAFFFVDSINDPVCGKFVLPVKIQRRSQGKSVTLGIHREFFRQNLLELVFYAPVQGLYVPEGIAGEQDGILRLDSAQGSSKTSSIVCRRPARTSSSMVSASLSKRLVSSRSARISRVARMDSRSRINVSSHSLSTKYFDSCLRFSMRTTLPPLASFMNPLRRLRSLVADTVLTVTGLLAAIVSPTVRFNIQNVRHRLCLGNLVLVN